MIPSRPFSVFLMIAISTLALANGSGTHGGSGVRLLFEAARFKAVDWVKAYKSDSMRGIEVNNWIVENADALAKDIEFSPYEWTTESLDHDAMTLLTPKALIKFSIPKCIESYSDRLSAGRLLIHESVHHLGVDSEYFADAVAIAISESYQERFPAFNLGSAQYIETVHNILREGPGILVYQMSNYMWSDSDRTAGVLLTTAKRLDPNSEFYDRELADQACFGWHDGCESLIASSKDIRALREEPRLPDDQLLMLANRIYQRFQDDYPPPLF